MLKMSDLDEPDDGVANTRTTMNFFKKSSLFTAHKLAAVFLFVLMAGACLVAFKSPSNSPPTKAYSDIPESLDYREKGVVKPIKDERGCHCGMVFAAVACLESKYAILTNQTLDLSEQQLLDCGKSFGENGCHGGNPKVILNFLQNRGVDMEAIIPYKANGDRGCWYSPQKYDIRILDWKRIAPNETAMKEAIFKHGPIIAFLNVDKAFFDYDKGVFSARNNAEPNHVVLIVGYGREDETDVWYIKNSWGTTWGKDGFMIMERGANLRNIAEEVYAIVEITGAAPRSQTDISVGLQALCFLLTIYTMYFQILHGI